MAAAAAGPCGVHMELGGKSAMIVFDDIEDIDATVDWCVGPAQPALYIIIITIVSMNRALWVLCYRRLISIVSKLPQVDL